MTLCQSVWISIEQEFPNSLSLFNLNIIAYKHSSILFLSNHLINTNNDFWFYLWIAVVVIVMKENLNEIEAFCLFVCLIQVKVCWFPKKLCWVGYFIGLWTKPPVGCLHIYFSFDVVGQDVDEIRSERNVAIKCNEISTAFTQSHEVRKRTNVSSDIRQHIKLCRISFMEKNAIGIKLEI